MPENATIAEIRERWPKWGEFPRRDLYPFPVEHGCGTVAEFNEAGINHLLSLNYRISNRVPVRDPYGERRRLWPDYWDEPFDRLGFVLMVWDRQHSTFSETALIDRPEQLTLELALELRELAAAQCHHTGENEPLGGGNCYHRYLCKVCGREWAVDSSG